MEVQLVVLTVQVLSLLKSGLLPGIERSVRYGSSIHASYEKQSGF